MNFQEWVCHVHSLFSSIFTANITITTIPQRVCVAKLRSWGICLATPWQSPRSWWALGSWWDPATARAVEGHNYRLFSVCWMLFIDVYCTFGYNLEMMFFSCIYLFFLYFDDFNVLMFCWCLFSMPSPLIYHYHYLPRVPIIVLQQDVHRPYPLGTDLHRPFVSWSSQMNWWFII